MSINGKDRARLYHPTLKLWLRLPFWPGEVSRELTARQFTEIERPRRRPLTIPGALTNSTYAISFTLRNRNLYRSVAGYVSDLERMAKHDDPVVLWLGRSKRGTFHFSSPPSVIELEWSPDGRPSMADVSIALTRATDATVDVGPIKRRRNRKPKK